MNQYSRNKESVTISKNILIIILIAVVAIMGGVIAYSHFNADADSKKAAARSEYVDEFDMIDPDNPMTKSDNLIRLKKRGKDLQKERDNCIEYIGRAKFSLAEQGKNLPPAEFTEKDVLRQQAIDYMTFYYRFPFFMDENSSAMVFKAEPGSGGEESVKNIVGRLTMQYNTTIMSHFRGANVWPLTDASGLLVFKKQEMSKPFTCEILKNLPGETGRLFEDLIKVLETKKTNIDADLISNSTEYQSRMEEYKNTRYDMSGKAISWGIIAFVLTAIVLYIAGLRSRDKLRGKISGDISPTMHEDLKMSMWYSVYLITVLLLIITIFVLGLARLLSENTLAALLGGIAGYVLNNKQSDSPKSVSAIATGTLTSDAVPVQAQETTPEDSANSADAPAPIAIGTETKPPTDDSQPPATVS